MNDTHSAPPGLSPDAAAVLRPLARLLAPFVAAELAEARAEDWIDQHRSPLGRRRHCELARIGAFPAHKDGRRWRALRAHVDAYIRSQRSGASLDTSAANEHALAEDEDPEVRALLADNGLDLTPQRRGKRTSRR